MSVRRSVRLALVVLATCASVTATADDGSASDPLEIYLTSHPGTRGEDLIEIDLGDPIDRVLAVVHNPESGLATEGVRVAELAGGVQADRAPEELAGVAGAGMAGSFLVLITQDCDERQPPPRVRPASWLLLRSNRVAAYDVVVYGPGCSTAEERFETSDHAAMRIVGEEWFRKLGRGRFRYGALRYDTWDDAFAAPTREATLSILGAHAAASPDDALVQNRLAVALHAQGERDAAFERLQRATRLDPGATDPHRNLAWIYRQRGQKEEALREETLASQGPPSAPGVSTAPIPGS